MDRNQWKRILIEGKNLLNEDYAKRKHIKEKTLYHSHLIELFETEVNELVSNDQSEVLTAINKNDLKTTAKEFHASLKKSKHPGMLHPYSVSELKKMRLFKVPDYNIGYALKKWTNGKFAEIVAVHNNEPEIKGIGVPLMQSAIKNGGCYLDHFDGFLSKLYSKLGFVEYDRDKYDAKYFDDDSFEKQYGKADVIYRVHKTCKR